MDDCIAKYLWVKQMGSRMADLKRAGKPLPKTVDEVEQMLGIWVFFGNLSGFSQRPPFADAQHPPLLTGCFHAGNWRAFRDNSSDLEVSAPAGEHHWVQCAKVHCRQLLW